ncbi:hypothetical protein FB565_002941 [Actinoplanes lutulentus]|uniref:Uncharacterized protein n=1 Tax=Actinoplanes lutulentus TaxID=1287878 RepID=A0A327Z175_9ACTN|nr:hypothetical protein [Actinoplanes lutulentus]MBB2943228.1 hypothetical protein [Actinoplanes lutulentus]RAK28290.1 hypothetical protein B0I29_12058 [Actinoplanes lutulentus]
MSIWQRRRSRSRLPMAIPPLKDLQYAECGYKVQALFTTDFVELHNDDWELAERDWARIVAEVLNSVGVERRATGGRAIKQAVEVAAAFLSDDRDWPWCPICKRGTDAERKESTDGH